MAGVLEEYCCCNGCTDVGRFVSAHKGGQHMWETSLFMLEVTRPY